MGKGLLLIVLAAGLAGAMLMRNAQVSAYDTDRQISQYEKGMIAGEIARSGLNKAVAHARGAFASIQTHKASAVDYQQGSYTVEYQRLASGALKIDVVGVYDDESHRISTTMLLQSPLDGAILVEADTATAFFDGSGFRVDGNDTRPPSLAGQPASPAKAKNGVKANTLGVRDEFRGALGAARIERVVGKEGVGDIVSGPFEADLQGLYQEAKEKADLNAAGLVNGSGKVAGSHTFGSAASPQIVYFPSSVEITGSVSGYGMLVVDGNLTVSGTVTWEGIVMAKKETGMTVDYGGNATIHGSLVLLQGSSAFTMPVDGKLKMTYKFSEAGYQSAVYLHTRGQNGADVSTEIFPKGSNRNGDRFSVVEKTFPQGAKMNFFIRTYATSGNPNVYDHYARGHNAPDGTPYARVTQDPGNPYRWTIEFEDLNVASGHRPDWDYNDQVIEVEVVPTDGATPEAEPFEPWWHLAGVHVEEDGSVWSNLAGWFRTSWARRAGIAAPRAEAPVFHAAMWTVEAAPAGAAASNVQVCKKINWKKWQTTWASPSQATAWIQGGQAKMGACNGNDGNKKVDVCHIPPGNPGNAHTINISVSAVDTHLRNHGDSLGACATEPESGGGSGGSGGGNPGGGSGGGATGPDPGQSWSTCTAQTTGRQLCFRMGNNAKVYYSTHAIARLSSRLVRIRETARLETLDHWTSGAH